MSRIQFRPLLRFPDAAPDATHALNWAEGMREGGQGLHRKECLCYLQAAAGRDDDGWSRRRLNWAADAEFAHARLERGALHPKERGGAAGSGDAPLSLPQGTEDVLALGFLERGDGRGNC